MKGKAHSIRSERKKTYLPEGFVPSNGDVVCAKGKKHYQHIGNQRFRAVIDKHTDRYQNAKTKFEKSLVVNEILEHCRKISSCRTGFVRQDESGRWFEIGDDAAREKIGQSVRDAVLRQDPELMMRKRKRRAAQKARRSAREHEITPPSSPKRLISMSGVTTPPSPILSAPTSPIAPTPPITTSASTEEAAATLTTLAPQVTQDEQFFQDDDCPTENTTGDTTISEPYISTSQAEPLAIVDDDMCTKTSLSHEVPDLYLSTVVDDMLIPSFQCDILSHTPQSTWLDQHEDSTLLSLESETPDSSDDEQVPGSVWIC